jgi:arylsulfatase A-like enzyme
MGESSHDDGREIDATLSSTDGFRTLLEMIGTDTPTGLKLDGISQVPALLASSALDESRPVDHNRRR